MNILNVDIRNKEQLQQVGFSPKQTMQIATEVLAINPETRDELLNAIKKNKDIKHWERIRICNKIFSSFEENGDLKQKYRKKLKLPELTEEKAEEDAKKELDDYVQIEKPKVPKNKEERFINIKMPATWINSEKKEKIAQVVNCIQIQLSVLQDLLKDED